MVIALGKIPILEEIGSSRTAHLRPLLDFLKAQGNVPWRAPSSRPVGEDGFYFDPDEYGTFYFEQPLDLLALETQFALPATIILGKAAVYDSRNFVCISQAMPQE
jgi:hypothetical protein